MSADQSQDLESVIVSPATPISAAIAQLDRAGTGALVVCTDDRKPYGLLTDGDIRRALIRHINLEDACGSIANRSPIMTSIPLLPSEALRIMNQHDINQLLVVNEKGQLVDFLLRKKIGAEKELEAKSSQRLQSVLVSPDMPILQAAEKLDKAGTGALVLCSPDRKLVGMLTDGDIRRAVMKGQSLERPCEAIASRNPTTIRTGYTSSQALHVLNEHDINQLPVVDEQGTVVDLLLRRDIVSEANLEMSAVIMAGGYGKRLLPLTEQVPKPMLPVGDRPLLERIIEQLRRSGIRDVNLTTHYLPDSIERHFGDGESFGVKLNYIKEDNPLGTAGGVRHMRSASGPFLVMNGDILTGLPFQAMLEFHKQHGAQITVGVRRYEVKVPYGVIESDELDVRAIKEKPSLTFFINAGIYLLEPSVCDWIPEGRRYDMTDLIEKLVSEKQRVISFPIMEYWLDVGQHADYKQAQEDIRSGKI